MTQQYETCNECGYAKPVDQPCPNPACWPGYAAYAQAVRNWEGLRTIFRTEGLREYAKRGWAAAPSLFNENFERENPRPRREDYERTK